MPTVTPPRPQIALFILVAASVYGGLHAYLWWKASRQLRLAPPGAIALALFCVAMVAAPFLGRLLRGAGAALDALELVTFLWMGAAFYLFCLNLGADLWNLAAWVLRRLSGSALPPGVGGPRLFLGILAATALIVSWGAFEAWHVRLRRHTVATPRLAPGSAPLRVVQVSDVHLGLLVGPRRLQAILDLVREARPDVLVATGDILDAVGDRLEPLAGELREVAPPLGKFAVTGNHEYYAGIPGALAFFASAGFRVLRDETAVIPGALNIVGKDFRAPALLPGAPARPRELADLIREGDPRLFTILLKHLPTGFEEETAPLGVDLQLSGHTHDGQLFPFRWLVRLSFRHLAGWTRAGGSLLYVSRGTGTWGPPLRFLAPPEVTLFTLVPQAP
jgi:predicted MPP superfamily phosphohydrolase/drug/metabolite transporter superfamily protein YnfA